MPPVAIHRKGLGDSPPVRNEFSQAARKRTAGRRAAKASRISPRSRVNHAAGRAPPQGPRRLAAGAKRFFNVAKKKKERYSRLKEGLRRTRRSKAMLKSYCFHRLCGSLFAVCLSGFAQYITTCIVPASGCRRGRRQRSWNSRSSLATRACGSTTRAGS